MNMVTMARNQSPMLITFPPDYMQSQPLCIDARNNLHLPLYFQLEHRTPSTTPLEQISSTQP